MENNKQAGYNIAYNSLERRFSKRGAVDIVNQLADEQQKKEKETAELSPVCYRLGAHKSSNDWNVRYRTGNTDGEYFMTVADYKRCFCEGMGYRPDNVIRTRAESKAEKWEADHNIELVTFSNDINNVIVTSDGRKLTPRQAIINVAIEKWLPREAVVKTEGRRFRGFPIGAVTLVLLFALLLAAPAFLSVRLKERSDAVVKATAELEKIDEDIVSLEAELNMKNDLRYIEDMAINEYGMIRRGVSTSRYIKLGNGDIITEDCDQKEEARGMLTLLNALGLRVVEQND